MIRIVPKWQETEGGEVAVLVDALRAGATVVTALACGAARVVPLRGVEEARVFAGRENCLTAGERGGAKLEGFDFGNSPTEILRQASLIEGRILALTTTNATQAVKAIGHKFDHVLVGSLINLDHVVDSAGRLLKGEGAEIEVICMGKKGKSAIEDDFSAWRIADKLHRETGREFAPPPDFENLKDASASDIFFNSPSGLNLIGLGYREDVAFCCRENTFRLTPEYRPEEGFTCRNEGDDEKQK